MPITFRLYPEPDSRLFCRVNVWQDKAEMLAYLRQSRGSQFAAHHSLAAALASGREIYRVYPDGRTRKSPEFCEINCHRGRLDLEVVSHEIQHAAFRWASRVELDPVHSNRTKGPDCSDEEERFCYAVGRMVNDFAKHLHRRKVWERALMSHETFDPDLS